MQMYKIDTVSNLLVDAEVFHSDLTVEDLTPLLEIYAADDVDTIFIHILSAIDIPEGMEHWYLYDPLINDMYLLSEPLSIAVTNTAINDYFFELDNSPVTMDGHTVDANPTSLLKMDEVSLFIGDDQLIEWTMADNSTYIFTGSEFKILTTRVKKGHLKRAYNLHAHAKMLKALLPDVFEEDLVESKWPMDTTIAPQTQGLCFL